MQLHGIVKFLYLIVNKLPNFIVDQVWYLQVFLQQIDLIRMWLKYCCGVLLILVQVHFSVLGQSVK